MHSDKHMTIIRVILVTFSESSYLFLYIFKIRAEHFYEYGHSSCLDYHPSLVGCT